MSDVYFRRDYIQKPKRKNNEREALERRYGQLLEQRKQYSTSSNNNLYKTGFWLFVGVLVMGGVWLAYSVGFKSGKHKYKYKRCKC